jgi:hypothetical protein
VRHSLLQLPLQPLLLRLRQWARPAQQLPLLQRQLARPSVLSSASFWVAAVAAAAAAAAAVHRQFDLETQ